MRRERVRQLEVLAEFAAFHGTFDRDAGWSFCVGRPYQRLRVLTRRRDEPEPREPRAKRAKAEKTQRDQERVRKKLAAMTADQRAAHWREHYARQKAAGRTEYIREWRKKRREATHGPRRPLGQKPTIGDAIVRAIVAAEGSQRDIARRFGVTQSTVGRYKRAESRECITAVQ